MSKLSKNFSKKAGLSNPKSSFSDTSLDENKMGDEDLKGEYQVENFQDS